MTPEARNVVSMLCRDFRSQLVAFYSALNLAPPYHSVEKSIRLLSAKIKDLPPTDRQRLLEDPECKWGLFERTFLESDLRHKHRGIIRGLLRTLDRSAIPTEFDHFLKAFQPPAP